MIILLREATAAARRGRLQAGRAWFTGILLAIVLATFASWYFEGDRTVSRQMMSEVAMRSFLFVVIAHATAIVGLATLGAMSIAGEMDRKTLGFVLATRLANAEIVLGKLAACLAGFVTELAAGLPVMILLYVLGGVHPTLLLLAYAAISSTALFVLAIAICVSSGASGGRRSVSVTLLWIAIWLILPVISGMTPLLSRIGLRPPGFVREIIAWLLASNPFTLLPMLIGGPPRPAAIYYTLGWMCGVQLIGAAILILGAIARLRPAFRANVSGDDGGALARRLSRPAWRFRPRPPMADDPILWREMHTGRGGLIGQLIGQLIGLCALGVLGYTTFFFARRAFVELWHHGYTAVASTAERPELNLVLRFFLDESGPGVPIDAARIDFNVFLRVASCSMIFTMALIASGIAVEVISTERAKETWSSLIATPLSARDILLGKLKATIWRLRGLLTIIFVLWTLGLLSGAIHPLGYLAALLIMAASTAVYMLFGLMAALHVKDPRDAGARNLGLTFLPIASAALPFLLPAGISSVLWGSAATPFVIWLALASAREVHVALTQPVYPALLWIKLDTAGGPLAAGLTCLIGIAAPALLACWMWKHSVANFDRWVGRPWRNHAAEPDQTPAAVPATIE
jgi:ABC-type transport system involved in multi-copper enzyme maturation permease subunit